MYVNTEPPRQYIGPVFVNTYTGVGPAAGTWQTVDLTQPPWNVPGDAQWADMRGILIITNGTSGEIADLGVIFRAPGDTRVDCTVPNFTGQTVQTSTKVGGSTVNGGSRSTMAAWVPLKAGQLEWCWYRSTQGQWPEHSSYGVNLSIHAWAR